MGNETILELKNITKTYPGVVALNDVSLEFRKGEVHALLGENGAGKSTLIKVIAGAIVPDSGKIVFEGNEFTHMTPAQTRALGISVVYQEFTACPALSAAENIFLGDPIRNGIWVDQNAMKEKAEELFKSLDIDMDPTVIVGTLSPALQQIVEICKAIHNNVKVLIMDEPSAPLTNKEVDAMFNIVRKLRETGIAIIYISHRMNEVFELSDRVTVLRDGQFITTKNTAEVDRKDLITYMVGRELSESYPPKISESSEEMLRAESISGNGVMNVSFSVHKGEVLGVAGLVGSGRTELMNVIFGFEPKDSGKVYIKGKEVHIKKTTDAMNSGIALIPEDRKKYGIITGLFVQWNISLSSIKKLSNKIGFINSKKEISVVQSYVDRLRIKTPSLMQQIVNLSGGNQQKVILARCLACDSEILIFDEPTRGIDVGAKHEIYVLMRELAAEGKAIIMVSSDMEELLGMSDRIVVMHEGEMVIEKYKWVGGQMTTQCVPPDEHIWIEKFGCTKSYRQLRDGIRDYYRRHYPLKKEVYYDNWFNPGQGNVSKLCHEPRVSLAVIESMIAPYRASGLIEIWLKHEVISAQSENDHVNMVEVRSIETEEVSYVLGKYFIDGTETGELLPLTGTEYVTGAESQDQTGEMHALPGAPDPKDQQAFSHCFILDYDEHGDHTIEKPETYDFWKNYRADFWPDRMLSWKISDPVDLHTVERPIFIESNSLNSICGPP